MLIARRPLLSILFASALLVACGEDDDTEAGAPSVPADVATTYADIVHATYADSLETARALDTAINAFVDAPTTDTLRDARTAWLAAREPYLQSEVFRFYDGPIDNADDGPEGLINAWPLDEAYIDYVADMPAAGMVQGEVEITAAALAAANEAGGEENIATGYHAIEFLLWGQDTSADGPGDRPVSDYVESMEGPGQFAERRKLYLTTASALLVSHLEDLTAAWAPDQDNYREAFEGAAPAEALRRIMTGMIVLSGFETGGERLQTALDSASQEDEHSCFSDNTHRDMVQDVRGVQNVYLGSYTRLDGSKVSGTGVRAAVEALDADLAKRLEDQIAESLRLAENITPPFDRAIALDNEAGRANLVALVEALRAQEDLLEQAFIGYELTVPVFE